MTRQSDRVSVIELIEERIRMLIYVCMSAYTYVSITVI
jgi:hypothetical protein